MLLPTYKTQPNNKSLDTEQDIFFLMALILNGSKSFSQNYFVKNKTKQNLNPTYLTKNSPLVLDGFQLPK